MVFAIVGFPRDVREVLLGDDGALAGSKAGNVLVDMTTSEPSLAVEIYDAAKAKGVHSVDAPVSGGDVGRPRSAALDHDRRRQRRRRSARSPAGRRWARRSSIKAAAGAGQHTKMVNQILIATEHDRRLRGAALRLQGRARSADRAAIGRQPARREAGRSRTSARGSWPTTSTPASSSSTSSRTWASPWPRRQPHGPVAARPGPGASALSSARRPKATAATARTPWMLALAEIAGIDWRKRK